MSQKSNINRDRISVSDNFFLDEFLGAITYVNLKALVAIAQFIREKSGLPVVINNWWAGGKFNWRGLRTADTTQGAPLSQHRRFAAIDINIGNMTGAQMAAWVRANAAELYRLGVRRIEHDSLTPTLLHLDLHEHGQKCIQVVLLKGLHSTIPIAA